MRVRRGHQELILTQQWCLRVYLKAQRKVDAPHASVNLICISDAIVVKGR